MTGKRITQDQIAVYRATRQAYTLEHAAKMAAISRSSASRIDNGLWDGRKHATRRDRRTKLSGVWDNAALPYLVEHPKASAKDVHQYVQRICPGVVSPSQRRTIERRCKAWKIEHLPYTEDDSVAFFHSAHQGCIDLSALSEQAKTSPDLQTLVRYAKSGSLRSRNRAILALAVLNEVPLGHVWRYLKISSSTSNR